MAFKSIRIFGRIQTKYLNSCKEANLKYRSVPNDRKPHLNSIYKIPCKMNMCKISTVNCGSVFVCSKNCSVMEAEKVKSGPRMKKED